MSSRWRQFRASLGAFSDDVTEHVLEDRGHCPHEQPRRLAELFTGFFGGN